MKYMILFVIVLLIVTGTVAASRELSRVELLAQDGGYLDPRFIEDLYTPTPHIDGHHIIGNKDAPITIIAVMDLTATSSDMFIYDIWPNIEPLVNEGQVRFIHKHAITAEDIEAENDVYKTALAMECVPEEDFEAVYFSWFSEGAIADHECALNARETIILDAYDAEREGLVGTSPTFYIGIGTQRTQIMGVPSWERFRKVIRQYQIQIGE